MPHGLHIPAHLAVAMRPREGPYVPLEVPERPMPARASLGLEGSSGGLKGARPGERGSGA